MNKRVLVSLSLIAVLLFDLVPLVFAAGGGGTHILRELPPSVVYVDANSGYIKQKTTSAGAEPSNSPGAVPYYAATSYYASTASSATTANTAIQANYATSAGSATSTTYASTSYFASTATHANTADTASSATYASSATIASSVNTGSGVVISGNTITSGTGGVCFSTGRCQYDIQSFSTPNLQQVTDITPASTTRSITTGGLTANGALTVTGSTSLAGLTASSAAISGQTTLATSSGNVGIGRTDPVEKLDVNGNIRAGGGYFHFGGANGYYIGDDRSGNDLQTNAPNIYVNAGGWRRLVRELDDFWAYNNLGFYHNNAWWTAVRDDGGGILHIAPWANQYSEVRIGTLGNTKLTATGGFYPSIKETVINLGEMSESDETSYTFKPAGSFYYDSSRYLGDVRVYFEVVAAQQCGARNGAARLRRVSNGAVISELTTSFTAPSYQRVRSGNLGALATGDYYVETKASSDTCDFNVPAGRIIIQVD